MGYPTYYWYPDGGSYAASREDTSLGETLSSLEEVPVVEREDMVALSGRQGSTVVGTPRRAVRITLERFTSQSVMRSLLALEDHLSRGGMAGFAADADDAWCGYLKAQAYRGQTVLRTTGNLWYFGGSLAANDPLVVQGLGPDSPREVVLVQSTSGDSITLSAGLKYTYEDPVVMVRALDCWPVLFWPQSRMGSPALTTIRRIHWTWDITMEEDLAVAAALASEDQSPLLGATPRFNGATVGAVTRPTGAAQYATDSVAAPSDIATAPNEASILRNLRQGR